MRKIVNLRLFQLLIVIFLAGFVGYFIGTNSITASWKKFTPIVSVINKNPPAGQSLDMKTFYEVFDRVNAGYYDKSKIESSKIIEGAINGMLGSLDDPYTSFFPPKRNTDFKTQLAGEFSGIGAELSQDSDKRIVVVSPLDSSPAKKAGIKTGDLIVKVDGEDTVGWTVAQAVEKIRGPKGTPVELAVLHEKAKTPVNLKIVRDTIVIESVKGWVKNYACENGTCSESVKGKPIAYIRLSQYGDKTNDEWVKVVNEINGKLAGLRPEGSGPAGKDAAGIILDLRNNPGGYLNDAVFIASEFIDKGVIVIQEDASKNQEAMSVSRRGTLLTQPMIVLINKGSASASEITAGALRDHNRAKLLGEVSFGKGTVQQAVDLDGGSSVHVSVAKWLTPNKTWVNKVGLKPDIEVKYDASKSAKLVSKNLDNQIQAAIAELLK